MEAFDRERLRARLATLAAAGVFVGTSSWKYAGWLGTVYSESRYRYRGVLAKSRFETECLREYAEVFKSVSVDATYYAPPTARFLEGLAAQVPSDFRFGFKVSNAFTVKRIPNHPRFAQRAGEANPTFLDVEAFVRDFLVPMQRIRDKVGIVMFEFSRFGPREYARGRDFVAELDRFLAAIPDDWPFGIELRNPGWLTPEYFACLASHGVAHVFNAWTQMPTVTEQLALPGSRSSPALVAGRFLLGRGREYGDTVARFEPFDQLQEINAEARLAMAALIDEGLQVPERRSYLYVNNRLEGCAPMTIHAVAQGAGVAVAERTRVRAEVGP